MSNHSLRGKISVERRKKRPFDLKPFLRGGYTALFCFFRLKKNLTCYFKMFQYFGLEIFDINI